MKEAFIIEESGEVGVLSEEEVKKMLYASQLPSCTLISGHAMQSFYPNVQYEG